MPHLSNDGLAVDVPTGWDARTTKRRVDEGLAASAPQAGESRAAVEPETATQLHTASFALPEERGDFGSGAVEQMRTQDVFVAVIEYAPSDEPLALFSSEGIPKPLRMDDFDADALQRPQAGQVGVQRFFHVGRRRFCLYVVLGHRVVALRKLAQVNQFLASLHIA